MRLRNETSIGVRLASLCAIALGLAACGPSEGEARAYLEEKGITATELKRAGSGFEFVGKKGDELCKGTVTIEGHFGSKSQTFSSSCGPDTTACKPGAADACVKLADALYAREAKVFPTEAANLYRTACTDKNAHSCGRLAEFEGIGKHWDKLRDFARQGCDLGDGDACRRLALTEYEGQGTAKNEANALELSKKACGLGSLGGCRGASGILVDSPAPGPASAVPFAEKGCKAKFDDSCLVLGIALYRSKQDYPTALTHLDAACENPSFKTRSIGCNIAALIHKNGLGVVPSLGRALAYFEKSCGFDDSVGCYNAALAYKNAWGVTKSPEKAAALFAKACKLGDKDACSEK
jgi:TPR repeat protein